MERIDDHTLGLRDAVMVFELIEEAPERVTGTSLEELERRGVHVAVSGDPGSAMISFNGTGDDGATFEGRIVPSRAWAFLVSSSDEDAAAELVQMVDERLRTLDQADG